MSGASFALAAVLLCLPASVGAQSGNPYGIPPDWPEPMMMMLPAYGMLRFDRLELRFDDRESGYLWDAEAWYGRDFDKLWLEAEGEAELGGSVESADFRIYYDRVISPFWSARAGVRIDARPQPERAFLAFGVQGLAPQWFEVDASVSLRDEGDLRFDLEVEYELLLTQRLILQPRFELGLAASDQRRLGVGSGLVATELGLRLRYEFVRELAPYLGLSWTRRYGETASLARAEGGEAADVAFLLGLRWWY